MKIESGLGTSTVHGVNVTILKPHLNGDTKKTKKDEFVPSDALFAAVARAGNGMEGGPRITLTARNNITMRDASAKIPDVYHIDIEANGQKTTVTRPGLVSGEFTKADDFSRTDMDRVVEVEEGQGIVVMQKPAKENGKTILDVIEEFKAVKLNEENPKVDIPAGYDYTIVNIGNNDLVIRHKGFRMDGSTSVELNSQDIRKMGGFAYYLVEYEEKPVFEINPRYNEVRSNDFAGIPVLPIPQE